MKLNKLTLCVLVLLLFLSACIANKKSFISKGEKTFIKLEHEEDLRDLRIVASVNDSVRTRGAIGFAVPYLFNMTVNEVIRIMNKDKEKYTAKYTAEVSDDLFYKNEAKDAGINITNIKLFRLVQSKYSDEDTAMVISMGIEQSEDGKFMRFFTKDIKFRYSKAKLKIGDNTADFVLNISLIAFYTDETQKPVAVINKEIGKVTMCYYNIPFDKKISKNELESYKSTWFPTVPRTQFNPGIFSRGNIQLVMTVTEYDNFTKRTTISPLNPADYLKNQSGEIKGIINSRPGGF